MRLPIWHLVIAGHVHVCMLSFGCHSHGNIEEYSVSSSLYTLTTLWMKGCGREINYKHWCQTQLEVLRHAYLVWISPFTGLPESLYHL